MPKFNRRNRKRIDPRYFLHENTITGDDILIKMRDLIDFVDAVSASSLKPVHIERIQQELKLLKTVVSEKIGAAIASPPEAGAPLQENLIQDPIGGTVRPDQLETIVIKDLEHCLDLARSGQFGFSPVLKNVLLRLETIKSTKGE